mgnify:CR=1 FL=1
MPCGGSNSPQGPRSECAPGGRYGALKENEAPGPCPGAEWIGGTRTSAGYPAVVLGAASLAMVQGSRSPDFRVIAVDNSAAMIERCSAVLAEQRGNIELRQADVRETTIENASMVVLNYTLQFLDLDSRDELMGRICAGLVPGGLLVLSEKVVDEDPHMEELLVDLHHEHKRRNDYSQLEISRKRAALENVLVPETVAAHKQRLAAAGFGHSAVWLRYFNFVSIVAIK